MVWSEAGREMVLNDEHPANAIRSISISFEPGSNVARQRDLHLRKVSSQIIVTEHGILIDCTDEPDKGARRAIRVRCDPDSTADIESDVGKGTKSFARLMKTKGTEMDS
jgi:hypothetical protein